MFNIIKKILYSLLIVSLLLMAGGVMASALNIPGGIKLFTVESGSMEPTIKTGSVVVMKPADHYQDQDIITFKAEKDRNISNPRYTTTHRIIQTKNTEVGTFFVTKGDANDAADPALVASDLILGKKILALPYLGYPISLAKTRDGLIFLIVIPATLIIYSELINIKNEVVKLIKAKKEKDKKSKKKKSAKKMTLKEQLQQTVKNFKAILKTQHRQLKDRLTKLFFLLLAIIAFQVGDTGAFFNDRNSVNNSFTAGFWEADTNDGAPELQSLSLMAPNSQAVFQSNESPTELPPLINNDSSLEEPGEVQPTATPSAALNQTGADPENTGTPEPTPAPTEALEPTPEPTTAMTEPATDEPTEINE